MGFASSRGNRPARLHSSMIGTRLSSMKLRAVSRTRRSSSFSNASKPMKSTPRNLMAGITSHPTKSTDKERETNQSSRGRESRQREPIRVLGYFPFEAAGNRDILSRKRRGSDGSTVKNPEEKKRLSLARDRRNRYGHDTKSCSNSNQPG